MLGQNLGRWFNPRMLIWVDVGVPLKSTLGTLMPHVMVIGGPLGGA